jgi:CBS domain-containing protein
MRASDIMSTHVITVDPQTEVSKVAALLLARHISAVPVVEADGSLVGIVSEGDLIHRSESDTQRTPRAWWLAILADERQEAREYRKSYGLTARDVMTREVVTIAEDTPLADIAALLETKRIKRVPVLRGGKIVGIVSRANLLQGLAAQPSRPPPQVRKSDAELRDSFLAALRHERWSNAPYFNATAKDGVLHLWGVAESDEEVAALRVVAERIAGPDKVESHLNILPKYFYYES